MMRQLFIDTYLRLFITLCISWSLNSYAPRWTLICEVFMGWYCTLPLEAANDITLPRIQKSSPFTKDDLKNGKLITFS